MTRILVSLLAVLLLSSTAGAAPCPSIQWTEARTLGTSNVQHGGFAGADYDGDGKLDLISAEAPPNTYVQLVARKGNGDGTFAAPVTIATEGSTIFVPADVDADGKIDVLFEGRGGGFGFIKGTAGGFAAPAYISTGAHAIAIRAANFDADPALEVLFASYSSNLFALYDYNGGTFTEVRRVTTAAYPTAIAAADFDGDGLTDVAVTSAGAKNSGVYFRKADGTFTAPLLLAGGNWPDSIRAADVNEDGRPDIVITNIDDGSIAVYRYSSARQFSAPAVYPVLPPDGIGDVGPVHVFDANGDGHLDLVAQPRNTQSFATLAGLGNGLFRTPTHTPIDYTPAMAFGDFDGDARPETIAATVNGNDTTLRLLDVHCATQVLIRPELARIPDGKDATFHVRVSGFAPGAQAPLGTVTVQSQTTRDSASATPDASGKATVVIAKPEPRFEPYRFTATFSGNADIPAGTSSATDLTVYFTGTRTVLHLPDSAPRYGEPWPVWVEVIGAQYVPVDIYVDGVKRVSQHWVDHGAAYLYLTPGKHTIQAAYLGNAFPPSESAIAEVTAGKALTYVSLYSGASVIRAGAPQIVQYSVGSMSGMIPPGSVKLFNGTTFLGTATLQSGIARFSITLPLGTHTLRATYDGSADFEGSHSPWFQVDAVPNLPFAIDARSTTSGVAIIFAVPSSTNIGSLRLYRRVAGAAAWEWASWWSPQQPFDTNLQRGVVYEYRMEGASTGGVPMTSNIDRALLYTDEGLPAGTTIRGAHFFELRHAVDIVRATAGLAPSNVELTGFVHAAHLNALQSALTEGRSRLGLTTPALAPVVAGEPIRAMDVMRLRELAR